MTFDELLALGAVDVPKDIEPFFRRFNKRRVTDAAFREPCCWDCGNPSPRVLQEATSWGRVYACRICKCITVIWEQDRMGGTSQDVVELFRHR